MRGGLLTPARGFPRRTETSTVSLQLRHVLIFGNVVCLNQGADAEWSIKRMANKVVDKDEYKEEKFNVGHAFYPGAATVSHPGLEYKPHRL